MSIEPHSNEALEDFAMRVHFASYQHIGELMKGEAFERIWNDLQRNRDYILEHMDAINNVLDEHDFEEDDPHAEVIPEITRILRNQNLAMEVYALERLRWVAAEHLVDISMTSNEASPLEAMRAREEANSQFAKQLAVHGEMGMTTARLALQHFSDKVESALEIGGHSVC